MEGLHELAGVPQDREPGFPGRLDPPRQVHRRPDRGEQHPVQVPAQRVRRHSFPDNPLIHQASVRFDRQIISPPFRPVQADRELNHPCRGTGQLVKRIRNHIRPDIRIPGLSLRHLEPTKSEIQKTQWSLGDSDSRPLACHAWRFATARFSEDAAANGWGAWIVSDHPGRLFSRDQAITALTVSELLEIGHSADHPLVLAFEEELW